MAKGGGNKTPKSDKKKGRQENMTRQNELRAQKKKHNDAEKSTSETE